MPWTCSSCQAIVPDSSFKCLECSGTKSSWTLNPDKTRVFVISRARFKLLRGQVHEPTPATEQPYDPDDLVEPEVARVLTRAAAARLFRRGEQPASYDILIVRLWPNPDMGQVTVGVDFAVRDVVEHRLDVPEVPYVDVPFVFTAGSPAMPEGFGFPGLHVVDITEDTELGFAPDLEFAALARPTVELPTEAAEVVEPRKNEAVCIPGGLFAFDDAYSPPGIAEVMRRLQEHLEGRPDDRLGVFGHTDAAGSAEYNKALSDRRAQSVLALLTADVERIDALALEEDWGVLHYRSMLRAVGCNTAEIITIVGPNTERAVLKFQETYNSGYYHRFPHSPPRRDELLAEDGDLGPKTEAAIREVYTLEHSLFLSADRFLGPRFSGCSEFNPRGGEAADDRRVTIVVYGDEEPTSFPCTAGDASVCPVAGGSCSFYSETVEEPDELKELRPFFDLQWLKGNAGKGRVHLSAITTVPDGTPCEFRVYRLDGEALSPAPNSHDGDAEPGLGEPIAALPGTIKLGVAFVKWTPKAGDDPFDEDGPRFVFRVSAGERWAYSHPPTRLTTVRFHTEDVFGYTVPNCALDLELLPEYGSERPMRVETDERGFLELEVPEGVLRVTEADGSPARGHRERESPFAEMLIHTDVPLHGVTRVVVRAHDAEHEQEYESFLALYERHPAVFEPGEPPLVEAAFLEFADGD